jgi:hypothetical protein
MTDVERRAGLCASCAHVRGVTSARGSSFVLCGRSQSDARYPKYPALPVLRCDGHEPPTSAPAGAED